MDTVYPPRPVYIYALVDPETDEVRYIGRTVDPIKRLKRHLRGDEQKRPTYKTNWLNGLSARDLLPTLLILEECTQQTWQEAERRWIGYYRAQGARLTNLTDGGDGMAGYQFTDEQRARLAEACRGRVYSAEARASMALAAQRRDDNLNPEEREARRQARRRVMLAIRNDPDLAAKREAARLESNRTPEFRAKISATQKGRRKSPEHRAKIGAGHRGKRRSRESIAKQVVAANATKARKKAERAQQRGQLCLFTSPTPDS